MASRSEDCGKVQPEGESPGAASLSVDHLLSTSHGPALLIDEFGHVVAANSHATVLTDALQRGGAAELEALVLSAARERRSVVKSVAVAGEGETLAFEVTLLPVEDDDAARRVVMLARETTVEQNFTNALIASRHLFKDLVTCSSDFAWETRADGAFGFVSPRGALGFSPRELNGRPAQSLLDSDHPVDGPFPFECDVPLEDVEMWMRRADGKLACLLVSSVPVYDEGGSWLGARGVCRDVTEARDRDAALQQARDRERLQGAIIGSIRDEIDPDRVLGVAAQSVCQALAAQQCWVFRSGADGTFALAASFADPEAATGDQTGEVVRTTLERSLRSAERTPIDLIATGEQLLAEASHYHDAINGAICVSRRVGAPAFGEDERALLDGIANHVGIAIEQVANHKQLEMLSRTDELTGLFNRRAFTEEVERRFNHLRRMRRHGVFLYIDLDNFKQVNDIHGHRRGDEALCALATLLSGDSRVGDIAARLGGDEFALWLEEADEPAAVAKAKALLAAADDLRRFSGSADKPLGISIGIAVTDPAGQEAFTDFVARADQAMYAVKRDRKGSYALVAAPPTSASPGGTNGRGEKIVQGRR